jgi:cytochrome b pre-mRNA-processing protein 3
MFSVFRSWFKQRAPDVSTLALAVHAAARRPAFYTTLAVPDSFDGRFELLVLHAHLMIRRLRQDGEAGNKAGQALFDALTGHFDEALRAIGVGDMSVGKRVKTMTSAVYGRLAAYDAGLDADDPAVLMGAVRRNLYGTVPDVEDGTVAAVAAYIRTADVHLQGIPFDAILSGQRLYPEPVMAAADPRPTQD